MKVGYIRVSSVDQNTERQLSGFQLDRIFTDHVSGRSKDRPALTEMLSFLREGDSLLVHSMDRLARNPTDLREIVFFLTNKNVEVKFIKENMTFSNDHSPMSILMLSVMGAYAEFERALIRERQKEGIEIAKKKGKYKGRIPSLTKDQINEIRNKVKLGIPKTKIAKEYKVSRLYIYRCLQNIESVIVV